MIKNTDTDHGGAPTLYKAIDQDLISMEEYMDHVNSQISQAREKLQKLKTRGSSSSEIAELDELKKLKKVVAKLKSQIPSPGKVQSVDSDLHHNNSWPDINKHNNGMMPNLYMGPKFERIIEPEDLESKLDLLPKEKRDCLLCFHTFPPMTILKRKFVIYWWIGDKLLTWYKLRYHMITRLEEDIGEKIFDMLIAEGFIEPIYQKCSLVPDSARMSLSVHSALTIYANLFHEHKSIYSLDHSNRWLNVDKYSYVLNVGEPIIDGDPKIFEMMKNIRIIYLGRWQSSTTHHIEVGDTKILHAFKNMENCTFLSLRGISLITELPASVLEISDMEILDLRACHNLEVIPNGIGSLRWLTHLDMSECYFLDHMPVSLANLSRLEVFKGFFIGDSKYKRHSCTLDDLSRLRKLRKLTIYTSITDFPTERHLSSLARFNALRKLTISWGGCSSLGENNTGTQAKDDLIELLASGIKRPEIRRHGRNKEVPTKEAATQPNTIKSGKPPPALPSRLQKLDLQCFRGMSKPSWLRPANLKQLNKLYIRGGQLCDLGQFENLNEEDQWNVEILRLKYLRDLKVNWEELMMLFPKLIYLHREECPKLISFPFHESDGWINIKEEMPISKLCSTY